MKKISAMDRRLMVLLKDDPLIATKKLASALDVTEKTVLNRISMLAQSNDLKVTAQWDMHSLGLDVAGHVYIHAPSRPVADVARELAKIDEVQTVSEIASWPGLYVFIVVGSVQQFHDIAHRQLAAIEGVVIDQTEIAAKVIKFRSDYFGGVDSDHWLPPLEELNPNIKVDAIDFDIVGRLQPDARISNREIARQLDVSEAMVRQRLKKLQDQSAVRKSVVINPLVFDYAMCNLVRVDVPRGEVDVYCSALAERDDVALVMKIVGRYNVMILMFGSDQQAINEQLQGTFARVSEITAYAISPIIKTYKYRYELVSLQEITI